ncbi:unnamed protein product [marine sediment metagenome]|uniref:Uncharacterized protein n=1 Tax=marine sediment metagenome TaxID=412755 RepID=X1GAU7_9ZZZZ
MVDLGPGQKPVVMPHYPHMLSEDTEVWSKFLGTVRTPIKEVWYDVHVGQGVFLPVGVDGLIERIARGITRKRIDVVCHVGGGYWVVEIKPMASMLAFGQALSYARLFAGEYVVDGEIWPIIVCDEADEDLIDYFDELGVGVFVND